MQPDLTVLIAHQRRQFYRPYFFELERSHKNYERQRRRFQAYGYLLSGVGQEVVGRVFERELGIVPERGMAVFVGADTQHAEQLRRVALTAVSKTTELWFTSLDRLLEVKTARRRDGRARAGRGGAMLEVETPIP